MIRTYRTAKSANPVSARSGRHSRLPGRLDRIRRGPQLGLSLRARRFSVQSSRTGVIELREGLRRRWGFAIVARRSRSDPVAAQVVAGRWTMPRAGEAVADPGGPARRWEPVKAGADGEFAQPGGGYLAFAVSSPDGAVMMLDASGHAMVTVNGEPHVGDSYANGIAQLPVRLRKGQSEFLFRTGRGPFKARLTVPKAPAFFNPGDLTTPDLIAGEPVDTLAAIVVVNATRIVAGRSCHHGQAARRGREPTRHVPSLLPLSVRKIGFGLEGSAAARGRHIGDRAEAPAKGSRKPEPRRALGNARYRARSPCERAGPGRPTSGRFKSAIDGSVQYYAVVPAIKHAADSPSEPSGPGPHAARRRGRSDRPGRGIRSPSRGCTSSRRPIAVRMGLTGKTGAGSTPWKCSTWPSGPWARTRAEHT